MRFIFSTGLFMLLISLQTSCFKKNAPDDLSGDNYIRGRVFFQDTLDYNLQDLNPAGNYLAGANVYLSYASDSTNQFIVSTTTDAGGYFTFANLQNQSYWVYADTSLNGIRYSGYAPVTVNGNSLNSIALDLYPSQTLENGALYVVQDPSGNGVITGAQVGFFSSPSAFQYSQSTDTLTGASYTCTTNGSGHAFQLNMATGSYQVLVVIQLGAKFLSATDTITVTPIGIIKRTIKL